MRTNLCEILFSLGLLVFTTFGCNKDAIETGRNDTQTNNAVKASTVSQKQNSLSNDANTTQAKQSKPITSKPGKSKTGTIIGPAFDCDNDGQADDSRVDYDGDGIPDECVIGDEKPPIQAQIDLSSHQSVVAFLDRLTKNCQETEKIQKYTKYTVCTINGKPVKASESNVELGDGLAYWFEKGKVRAVKILHTEELFIFDERDNLAGVFFYDFNSNKMKTVAAITDEQIRRFPLKSRRDTYKNILKVFNL
ncbi:hypothetical protein [Mastigocoleus testarum]|uniref:Uncharacterized protein n=1 Tax=Mastigocoleus testarum BC008 TaxID=371196 RepID=A0A0V7ZI69_9CYAN|nr:hypothetical protein [Mastigocoleus testarum]KST63597.1 hypothetical protein BC008_14150 [Mastigocoleus testarum BC008]KST64171.1 hypothetical protein BC008_16150 [Mastigocoleus testarum BC008]